MCEWVKWVNVMSVSQKILFYLASSILIKTTNFSTAIMSTNTMRMARNHTQHSVWTQTEQEELIQWLEEPHNLQKTKKGSGISKKTIIAEIAARIPSKPAVKVGYKYDNLMKSYRAAAKLNNQSGWGLNEGYLNIGRMYLRGTYIKL